MTEQSRMDRSVSSDETVDDPLEELARIVSGEPDPVPVETVPSDPRQADDLARLGGELSGLEEHADNASAGQATPDPAFDDADLEAQLLAELGGAPTQQSAPAGDPAGMRADDPSMLPAATQAADAYPSTGRAAPQPSLEDALLMELGDPMAGEAGWQQPAEPSPTGAPESDTPEAPPASGVAAQSLSTEEALAAELFPDTGFNEPELAPVSAQPAPERPDIAGDRAAADAETAAPEHSDAGLPERLDEEFANLFEAELQSLEDDLADAGADAGPDEAPPQPDANGDEYDGHAAPHDLAGDFGTAPDDTVAEPVHFQPREAETDIGIEPDGQLEQPATPAAPAADLDLDFGAAFDLQVREMEGAGSADAALHAPTEFEDDSWPGPVTDRHDTAPAPRPVDLEEEFAAAFAEELDMGRTERSDVPEATAHQPFDAEAETISGAGWQDGETGRAGEDFAAMATSVPAGPSLHAGMEAAESPSVDDHGGDGVDRQAAPQSPGKGSGRGFQFAAGALALALLLGGAAVGYSYFAGSGDAAGPVIVRADTDPVKVKPDDPGGAQVANQDRASYQRVAGEFDGDTGQERLVSDTEEPVNVAALSGSTPDADARKAEERLSPQLQPAGGEPVGQLQPRKVRTVAVKPDGSIIPGAAPNLPSLPDASAPTPAAIEQKIDNASALVAENAATAAASAAADQAQQIASIDGARSDGEIGVPTPRPASQETQASAAPAASAPEQPAAAPAQPAAESASQPAQQSASLVSPGAWAVQLASQRTAEDAQATFQTLRERYASLLSDRQMSVQRADIEGRGVFYRVRAFAATRDEAISLCENLKAAGGSCFVTQ